MMPIQKQLKAYLKETGTSNYRFAKLHGFSVQSVGHWVSGKHSPSYDNLQLLNSILNPKP